jgi:hypothetical protein
MPTVQDVLKESGFTDEQIQALDQRAVTAFTNVLSTAERERQANTDFYENQIAPSLVQWDEEKTRMENDKARIAAENAFYKAQNEAARSAGFVPADAPGYTPPRDGAGRYVAGGGGTPGSPTFEPGELVRRAGDGLATIADIDYRHRQLFDNRPMPMLPSELVKQADMRRLSPMAYAEQTFGFRQREQELQQKQQADHDEKIRKDAVVERDRYWAERTGSNPDVRMSMRSPEMTDVARAAKAGKLPDPLMLNDNERRAATRQMIRTDLQEQN